VSGALKEKRRLCPAALEKLQLQAAYRLLAFLQAPFAFGFWRIEQAKARIEDRIENERSET
jgi:hypothetical protein